ncbi:hypothetical protein [Azospirillum canadense]|uniref:hypothetical protein n=1 Tax=Azospirillum canadense TaxID=403962 RepID=UPI0022274E72|nr:hypothetical protein [Azospirillum canadense]MCW2237955.1 hypothetical protein [Azospirillum canadense]
MNAAVTGVSADGTWILFATPPFTIPPTDTTSSTDMQRTVGGVSETVKDSARSGPIERHRWGRRGLGGGA